MESAADLQGSTKSLHLNLWLQNAAEALDMFPDN